jgi:uncharacterized protein
MSEQTPAAVAAAYFDALGRGDVPAAMGLLSPRVVWHQPGANRSPVTTSACRVSVHCWAR